MDWTRVASFLGGVTLAMLIRYFGIAGTAWAIFYKWRRAKWAPKKLQPRWPQPTDIQREIIYSLITSGIFAVVGLTVFNPVVRPYTQLYSDPLQLGWGYLIASFFATIIIHDAYFYWMHRFLHTKLMFKAAHLIHHKSTNPTPFAALAFHPIEAIFEAAIIYILAFSLPLHGFVLIAFLLFMFVYNVYGHLGWEIYPKWFRASWMGRWLNTSTAHNAHHQYFRGNYGLYFLWWDKWMGTYRD